MAAKHHVSSRMTPGPHPSRAPGDRRGRRGEFFASGKSFGLFLPDRAGWHYCPEVRSEALWQADTVSVVLRPLERSWAGAVGTDRLSPPRRGALLRAPTGRLVSRIASPRRPCRGPSRWPPVSPCSLSIDNTETARDPLLWLRGDRIALSPFTRAPRDQWSVHKHP